MQIINRTLRDCTNITPGDIQEDLHLHREDDASDMKVKKTKKTYISLYSTENSIRVGYPTQKKMG